MGGSAIGVWCAHGEGQCLFPDQAVQQTVMSHNLAPIRSVRVLWHAVQGGVCKRKACCAHMTGAHDRWFFT